MVCIRTRDSSVVVIHVPLAPIIALALSLRLESEERLCSAQMRPVKPIATEVLEAMDTRRLLGHLSRLRACEESFAASDLAGQPLPPTYDPTTSIYFKDDPRWQQQWREVKRILATREHLPRR